MKNARLHFAIELADGSRINFPETGRTDEAGNIIPWEPSSSVADTLAAFPAEGVAVSAISVGFYAETDAGEARSLSINRNADHGVIPEDLEYAKMSPEERAAEIAHRRRGDDPRTESAELDIHEPRRHVDVAVAEARLWLTENGA